MWAAGKHVHGSPVSFSGVVRPSWLTGPLESKEALLNKKYMEKAGGQFPSLSSHDHCTLGSQHSPLLYASFLDFSKYNQLHH